MRLTLYEAPTHETRHNTGTTCPTLFNKCVGSLSLRSTAEHNITLKMLERGLWFTFLIQEDLNV